MPGLLDAAPATFDVAGVQGPGVSSAGIAYLLATYPELRMYVTGVPVALNVDTIIKLAPNVICDIIACGCGYVPGETDETKELFARARQKAASLNADVQLDMIDAILKITMPGGVGPFAEKIEAIGKNVDGGFGNIAASNSPPQS
jgi:hypothetical protein